MEQPRFFSEIGTVPHAERLNFLTQDVRAAGTVFGFYGAAAAIGAKPTEVALMVWRKHRPDDRHRQIVLVFQQDSAFARTMTRLYASRGKRIGFEGQQRWCAIAEPDFLGPETYALLAARFPTLLVVEELDPAQDEEGRRAHTAVFASAGFTQRPKLRLAPSPIRKPAPKPQQARPAAPRPQPRPAAKVVPIRPSVKPAAPPPSPAPSLPSRRPLRSAVALNERVERQVVNEFRRLIEIAAYYG